LYNYWTVSTVNRDLLQRIHTIEQQAIVLSRSKEVLQENVNKVEDEKSSLQLSLHQEEAQEVDLKQRLQEKESIIKELQNTLERAKKSSETLRDELTSRKETSQKEISELKEKVVSLEAQVVEKTNTNEELQEQLESTKKSLDKAERIIEKLKISTPASAKSTPKVDDPLAQPVLLNDPAVPYPDGWMDRGFSKKARQVQLSNDVPIGLKGPISHNSPVIIFDPPTAKRSKARFSVLDQPKPDSIYFRHEQQMNPEVLQQPGAGSLSSLKSDKTSADKNNAAELGVEPQNPGDARDGMGVLPIPGGGAGGENLDAAEDDGDHPLKEDGNDQSPDGTLSAKERKDSGLGVGPAPPPGKGDGGMQDIIPGHGGQSGQDVREAAHLSELSPHNTL